MVENWEKSKLSISWISRRNLGLFSTSRWKPQLRLHLPESSFDWDLSLLADSIPDWLIKECHLAIQQIALPWRKRCHYSLVSTGDWKQKKNMFHFTFWGYKKTPIANLLNSNVSQFPYPVHSPKWENLDMVPLLDSGKKTSHLPIFLNSGNSTKSAKSEREVTKAQSDIYAVINKSRI